MGAATLALATGCCEDATTISPFWPGLNGIGLRATPEFGYQVDLVAERFRSGDQVEPNLKRNVVAEISNLEYFDRFEVDDVRSVSDYAALAYGTASIDGTEKRCLVLVGIESVVEVIAFYEVGEQLIEEE